MKILVINPNTNKALTEEIVNQATKSVSKDTIIEGFSPIQGPLSITCEKDEKYSEKYCLEELGNCLEKVDGIVIACYSDHSLIKTLRSKINTPVVGIMEASLTFADQLGKSPLIVTSGSSWIPTLSNYLSLTNRRGIVRAIDLEADELFSLRDSLAEKIYIQVQDFLSSNNYALCLGCSAMTGIEKLVQKNVSWPVVDGVKAAVMMTKNLIKVSNRYYEDYH